MLRRWLRRLVFALALFLLLLVVALLVGSRTAVVREMVRRQAVTLLAAALDVDVRIGAVGGSFFHTLMVEDLRLVVDGRTVVRVPRLEASYGLLPLVRGELRLERVTLTGPRIRAVRTASGWQLPHARGGGGGGSAMTVVVGRLEIADGRIAAALADVDPPRRFAATALALEASAHVGPARRTLEVAALRFVPRGIALSPVEASASVAAETGGALRVSDLELATARSRLAAHAVLEPGRRVDAHADLALAAADVRAVLPRAGVTADLRTRARVRGPWRAIASVIHARLAPGGAIVARVTTDATAEPFAYDTHVALAELDPGAAWNGLPRAALNGELSVRGRGVDPKGPVRYRLALHDSGLAGQDVERLTIAGNGTGGVHRVRAAAAAPLGDATLRARLGLGSRPRYRASARYTVARLDLLAPAVWGWASGGLRLAGHGTDPARRRARADVSLTGAALRGIPLERAEMHARLNGQDVELRSLTVEGHEVGVRLDAAGRVDLGRRDAELTLEAAADLDAIGIYLGQPLGGRATLAGTARGQLDALAVEGTATVAHPSWKTVAADGTGLRVDLRGLGGSTPGGTVHLDAASLRVHDGHRYATRGELAWRRAGGEDRAEASLTAASDDGRRQEIALAAVRAAEHARVRLDTLALAPADGPPWRLVRPAEVSIDSTLAIDRLELARGAERVTLAGRIARTGGTSDATLTLERVALAPLCVLGDAPPCGGELSGRVALAGTAPAPRLDVGMQVGSLEVARVPYGTLALEAHYAETRGRLHASLRHPQAGEVVADGEVPIDLGWSGPRRDLSQAPLSLTARADRLDLTIVQALAPRTLRSSAGRLSFDLRASGPRAAPNLQGRLALDEGRVDLIQAGTPYEHIRARLDASGTRVTVREVHAEAGDGTADVTGTVDLARGGPTAVDLAARLDRFFAVRRDAYEAAVSGTVAVGGTVDAPAVSGTVTVDRAVVRPAGLPGSEQSVPHDQTISVMGGPDRPVEPAPSADTELGGPLKLAVRIDVERNAWIRRNDANIELGGELELTKAANEPVRVFGQIRLVRGWYVFQSRRFTLDQGTITFTGASPPQPTFDVTAVYTTPEYRIEIHVTGSADKPHLDLTSDPPLEKADILAVVLFGKPAHQLGRGESVALQQQAMQLASGYVMPELRTSVMDALGLDTLEVEMPQGTTTPGRVSAGRYVTEDVFLSLGQEFGPRVGQVVGIEYSLGRNVSVRGSTSTRGNSAVDLFWNWRY